MNANRAHMRGPLIGLDIGSFAVRAAEVTNDGGHPTLQRFAQVTLPPGAVSDGEVVDSQVVSAALRRLWSDGGFSSRRVVLGVSSQRVIVRQADVTAMSEDELRSALNFEAQDLIPIPVDQAVLDFQVIDPHVPGSDPHGPPNMRILLAAAQRDMVKRHMTAARAADLDVVAVDPSAVAMLRAVPPASGSGAEAVISIGGDLTTIAIREGWNTQFVRVLNMGGSDLTDALSRELALTAQSAEDVKRRAGNGASVAVAAHAQSALALRMGSLVDEIRGSLDFFLAQTDVERVGRVVLTGGAIQTEGLAGRLGQALVSSQVEVANPLAAVAVGRTGLSDAQLRQSAPYMLTPIGLALWGSGNQRAISLMPKEVLAARRNRRQAGVIAMAVGAFAGLLVLASAGRAAQVTVAHHDLSNAKTTVASLQAQKATFNDVATVYSQLQGRQQLYITALGHDVDWVKLLNQITSGMPADVSISTVTAQRPAVSGTNTQAASSLSTDGTITFNATAKGGQQSVADWLRSLYAIPGLQNAWVENSTETGQGKAVSFNSDAQVTPAAESSRAKTIGGTK